MADCVFSGSNLMQFHTTSDCNQWTKHIEGTLVRSGIFGKIPALKRMELEVNGY